MSARVRGVLFDLDDTLFDHNHATVCTTGALRESEPAFAVWPLEELRRRHSDVLEVIHREVISGRMSIDDARRERFRRLLAAAGAGEKALERAPEMAARYREEYQRYWRPVAGAVELLIALKSRGFKVAIVTNNLTAEQEMKIRRCAFDAHVDALITSENAGASKPDVEIFTAALTAAGIANSEAVMVGDAWDTDIAGALAASIRPVWFNWRGQAQRDRRVAEITSLTPLESVLDAVIGGPDQT